MSQEMYVIDRIGVVNYNPFTNQSQIVTVDVPKLNRIYICGGIIGNSNIYLDEIYYMDLGNAAAAATEE
jgi:hypothetical protein